MSTDDEASVHRPNSEGTDGERSERAESGETDAAGAASEPEGFGARGWVLVGVLVVCTIVIPGIIYVRPGVLSAIGIPYIASLLVLPLLPAAVLGLTAVWAMTAATHDD